MRILAGIFVFALLVTVFALQNAQPVSIRLLFWNFPAIPLVLVIMGTTLLGLISGFFWGRFSGKRRSGGGGSSNQASPAKPPEARS